MTGAFDNLGGLRVVKVSILINGVWHYYQDLDIRIQGQRFFSETSAFCTIQISNITREERNWLLTNATPIIANNKKSAYLAVDVGRETGGTFRLFEGTCYTSTVTQPPDIGIIFRALDSSGLASAIQPTSFGPLTKLSTICQYVALNANANGPLNLDFKVTNDIQIANFSTTGNTNDLIPRLNQIGGIVAVANGKTLLVTDANGFNRDRGFILSQQTGMVGLPQATESGCIAQMLVRANIEIGDLVTVNSLINPSVNGKFRISQIAFNIANRDTPFFYTLTLTNKYTEAGPSG